MDATKLKYALNHIDELPELAYCLLPSNWKQVIIVEKETFGYHEYQEYPTVDAAQKTIDHCNSKLGVTEEQAEALLILSMRKDKTK